MPCHAIGTSMTDDELIAKYIAMNPYKSGVAEARLTTYWIPVWALIGYLPAVGGDLGRVAQDYHIPREMMDAAYAYYRRHQAAIDARIEANSVPIAGTVVH
jgi:uncharacterized protein (DUF433 family)